MYELELAFMVISHSQRDPGEHLLQLQQLAAQPEGPLRRHAIDVHLGRWRHALSDLLQAGRAHFEQALALATDKVNTRPAILIVISVSLSLLLLASRRPHSCARYGTCSGLQAEFFRQVSPHTAGCAQSSLSGKLPVQGLLRELLSELDGQDPRRTQVMEAYGEQLADRNLAEDSAVAFLAAGVLQKSLQQYKAAGRWQMALCLAGDLGMFDANAE